MSEGTDEEVHVCLSNEQCQLLEASIFEFDDAVWIKELTLEIIVPQSLEFAWMMIARLI